MATIDTRTVEEIKAEMEKCEPIEEEQVEEKREEE